MQEKVKSWSYSGKPETAFRISVSAKNPDLAFAHLN
jgi:hypothetical protein